jgi:phospholipid transport system substrate-binding protein
MQRVIRFKLILVLTLIALSARGAAATSPGPSEVIQHFCAELLGTMQNAAALGTKGRYQKLEPVVLATFDLPYMTRLAVGPPWAKLASDEKERAWKAFARYVTATYAAEFDGYSGEKFEQLGEQVIKHGTLVRTRLVKPDGDGTAITYMLHDNDTAWQVRDVYLAGTISQLATQRSQFTATLRSSGIEGLIALLNKKADDLQG